MSGRWAFASGITHSDWVWAGCLVIENGQPRMTAYGPEIIHVCMPVSSVVIHDTWHVSGLRGTGSNDFSADDVFVPEERIFALLDPSGHRREPLYQMPPLGFFVDQVAAVSLGIARAALDELLRPRADEGPDALRATPRRPAGRPDRSGAGRGRAGRRPRVPPRDGRGDVADGARGNGSDAPAARPGTRRRESGFGDGSAGRANRQRPCRGQRHFLLLFDTAPRARCRGRSPPFYRRAVCLGGGREGLSAPRAFYPCLLTRADAKIQVSRLPA